MQRGIDASGHQHQPADGDQPGDQAVTEFPGVELAFKKVREPDQRFVHQLAVGQRPKLLKEQNGDKRKKSHGESIKAYHEARRARRKSEEASPTQRRAVASADQTASARASVTMIPAVAPQMKYSPYGMAK